MTTYSGEDTVALISENRGTGRNVAVHHGRVVSLEMNVMKSKNERN
jgi:hypothetical protein